MREVTSNPVAIKNHPTPPTQPMRICLGMNPTIYPNPEQPIMKNTMPVKMELSAYEVTVVAMTAFGFSSPTIAVIVNAI
jgi:hypothetical protein